MMAERWVSDSGQRCDSGARENAAALGNGDYGVTLRFIIAGARESEVREQNEASTSVTRLISPCWPDQPGQRWHTATMRRTWPAHGWPLTLVQIDIRP